MSQKFSVGDRVTFLQDKQYEGNVVAIRDPHVEVAWDRCTGTWKYAPQYLRLVNLSAHDTGGLKHDSGKPRMDLLSAKALFATAQVLTYGKDKYEEPHNWRKGIEWSRLLAATLRHLWQFIGGEDLDGESGLCHLDHAATNLMMLQEFFRTRADLDDRYKGEKK